MVHMFDVDIAAEYGLNQAIILWHLYYWHEKNKANEKHFYDGLYWTYNSIKAFKELFPYLSKDQLALSIKKLETFGLIKEGNYNSNTYDRTKWYALTEKGLQVCETLHCISEKSEMESGKIRNGLTENPKPIPDKVTVSNTNNNLSLDKSNDMSKNAEAEALSGGIRRVISEWNSLSSIGVKPVKKVSSGTKLYDSLSARIREYGEDEIIQAIDNVRHSPFLLSGQFRFTFDWFVKPNNFQKVFNGNYVDSNAASDTSDSGFYRGEG